MQSMSVSSKPSMNDCSDRTNIRLHKFSISTCCSIVILFCGTCLTPYLTYASKYQRQESVKTKFSINTRVYIYNSMIKTTHTIVLLE